MGRRFGLITAKTPHEAATHKDGSPSNFMYIDAQFICGYVALT